MLLNTHLLSLLHLVLANVAKSVPALVIIPQTPPEIVDGHVVLVVGVVRLARRPAGEGVHVRPIGPLPDPLLLGVGAPTQARAQDLEEVQASEETKALVAWSGMEARSLSSASAMFSAASLQYQRASHQNARWGKNL